MFIMESILAAAKIQSDYAELLGIVLIAKFFVPKLLAGKVKNALPAPWKGNHIVAVIVPALAKNSIHLSAKNVLRQESRD